MKILTWNILASEWIDDKTYHDVVKKIRYDNKRRFDRIFYYITKQNADLILLQEVMPCEYKKIKLLFKNEYIITPVFRINWHKNKNNSGNVSLFKRTEFVNNMTHNKLEFGMHTTCLYKNKICHIYNIHLSDVSNKYRYTQLNSILKPLIEATTCIIGGDFNHQYINNTKFYNIPNYKTHNTMCTTYYIDRKINIDNILTKGFTRFGLIECPKCPENIQEGLTNYGSDHLPITLNIV